MLTRYAKNWLAGKIVLLVVAVLCTSPLKAATDECVEYRADAESGDAYSQLMLGGCLAVSRKSESEVIEAKRWYSSVINGDGSQRYKDDAAAALAGVLLFFSNDYNDHRRAIDLLRNKVSAPHGVAYTNLGLALVIGRGVKPSPEEGIRLLNKAAEASNQLAAISLFTASVNCRFGLEMKAADKYWELWLKSREFFTMAEKCAMATSLSEDEIFGRLLFSTGELVAASNELSSRLGCELP